jgi:hypothetical protein
MFKVLSCKNVADELDLDTSGEPDVPIMFHKMKINVMR